MKDKKYQQSFDLFLKRTDEKEIILRFIEKIIKFQKIGKFLDIGAGNGSLSLHISKNVSETLAVEPNEYLFQELKKKKLNAVNEKWEDIAIKDKFDFILVAYAFTYFPVKKRERLIKKMFNLLNSGGRILFLSVDPQKGTWRKVHNYFYDQVNLKHQSADDQMREILSRYPHISKNFKTKITAKSLNEMMLILYFSFVKYENGFIKFSAQLKKYLEKYQTTDGHVTLEMQHNAFIINKP